MCNPLCGEKFEIHKEKADRRNSPSAFLPTSASRLTQSPVGEGELLLAEREVSSHARCGAQCGDSSCDDACNQLQNSFPIFLFHLRKFLSL